MTKTETRNYYTSSNYTHSYTDHFTFGGLIYEYDFDGYNSMSDIANRIVSDMKFDKQCKLNAKNRDKNKNNKKEEK